MSGSGQFVTSVDPPGGNTTINEFNLTIVDTDAVAKYAMLSAMGEFGNVSSGETIPNPTNIQLNDLYTSLVISNFKNIAIYEDVDGNHCWTPSDRIVGSPTITYGIDPLTGLHKINLKSTVAVPESDDDSTYLLCIATASGWGENKVGYGDEFSVYIDSIVMNTSHPVVDDSMSVAGGGDGEVKSGMLYTVVGPITTYSDSKFTPSIDGRALDVTRGVRMLDVFFGLPTEDPVTGNTNNTFLDFIPDAVLGIDATGGPSQPWLQEVSNWPAASSQALEQIRICFEHGGSRRFSPSDLRALTGDKHSGVQVYRDYNPPSGAGSDESRNGMLDPLDELIPIAVSDCIWTEFDTGAELKLVLDNGEKLPLTGWHSTYNTRLGASSTINNAGPDFFVTILLSEDADYGDSFTVRVPGGGLTFSNGTSNPTPKTLSVLSDTFLVSVPTMFYDMTEYWANPGEITERSEPYAVLGLNVSDTPTDTAYLKSVGIYIQNISGGTDFTVDDLMPLGDTIYSGVALYRDCDTHPQNTNGQFDPGIDICLPLNGTESWAFGQYNDHYNDHFTRLTVADSTFTSVPNDDLGANGGPDFFIVIRTSSTASNGHDFRVKMVDPAAVVFENASGAVSSISFHNADPATNGIIAYYDPTATYYAAGSLPPAWLVLESWDPAYTHDWWSFTSNTIRITAISALSIEDYTIPGQLVDVQSDAVPVFGINISDGTDGNELLTGVTVRVSDGGTAGNFTTSDLAALTSGLASGISLYQDNGDSHGIFDANDDIVQCGTLNWTANGEVTLAPTAGVAIPDDDSGNNAGADFFVVFRTSASINYLDDFVLSLVPRGVQTNLSYSDPTVTDTTHVLTCRVPTFLTDLTTSEQKIGASSDPFAVIGINMNDQLNNLADGQDTFAKLTVAFSNIGGDLAFTSSDLAALLNDTSSGISVWIDQGSNNVGSFDRNTDLMVPLTVAPVWSGIGDSLVVLLDIADQAIPGNDTGDNAGVDFYVVIRSSGSISYDDNFSVSVVPQGVEYFSGKSLKTLTTNSITSNAVTSTELTDLVGSGGAWIESHGDTLPIIGINVYDAPSGSEYISQITLRFRNTGTALGVFDDSDLAALSSDVLGGIQLYRDDGTTDGQFDAADSLIPLNGAQSFSPLGMASDSYQVTIMPFSTDDVQLPADNVTDGNVGPDFYIVVKTSSTMQYGDDFFVELEQNGISYSAGPAADTIATGVITCRVPTVITDLATETGSVYKRDNSDTFAILGINTWDNGRDVHLKTVKVTFTNVSGFTLSDLNVALYRDAGAANGVLDALDTPLLTTQSSNQNVLTLTLAATGTDSSVPNTDAGVDQGADFLVVIGTTGSANWKSGDRFTYAIAPGGLEFETAAQTITSQRSGYSANSIIGDITPPNFVSTTTTDADRVYRSGDTLTFTSKWTEAVTVVALFPDTTMVGSNQGNGNFYFSYPVPTPVTGLGDTQIWVIATDAQGNTVANNTYGVEFDTDGPSFVTWGWGDTPPIYSDGDTVTLYASFNADAGADAYGTDSIVVTADFSAVDSAFDTANVTVTRLAADRWKITYVISSGNTKADADTIHVRLLAHDYANYASDTGAWLKLDNTGPQITAVTWLPTTGDQNVRNSKVVHFTFNVNETTDTTRTVVDFGQVDAGYLAANVATVSPNGTFYDITYTVTAGNTRQDNEQIAVSITLYDAAGNMTTDSATVRVNLDNTNPSALITSPADSTAFNSSPISIFGTANDPDGNSAIDGKQASEVAAVRLRVIADTGAGLTVLPGYGDTTAFSTADTAAGELAYSKWQFVFRPTDTGTYYLSTVAVDQAGNPVAYASAFADTTVIRYLPAQADLLPPTISNLQASPSPFSPNGDGVKDTTYIQYSLSEQCATATITLKNSSNSTVRVLTGDTGAGANEVAWNGRHTDGYILPDGLYTFTVRAVDPGGNSAQLSGSVRIATALPTITSVSATPSEISPNGDGINENSTISFTVGNMASSELLGNLTYTKTAGSASVATTWANPVYTPVSPSKLALVTQEPFTYSVSVTVQGTDANGFAVSDQFTITANTAANTIITTDNGIAFQTVSSLSVANSGAATGDAFAYDAKLYTNVGSALLRVVDALGASVTSSVVLSPTFIGAGTYTGQWPAGAQADGVYTYQITVIDDFGNEAAASGNITCASTRIELSGVGATPYTTISPNGDLVRDNTFITYTINKPAQVTVQIFSGATAVTTLQADTTTRAAGTYAAQWDGDTNGILPSVASGEYTARVTAYDPALNESVLGEVTITVDNERPDTPVIISPRQEATGDGNSDGLPGIGGFDDDNDGAADAADPEVLAATTDATRDGIDNDFDGVIDEATETYVAAWDDNENGMHEEPYFVASTPVSVTGTAEANSTVTAFINGGSAGSATTDAFTSFTIANVALSEGLNRLTVRATDGAGNVGNVTTQQRIVLDSIEPAIDYVVAETTVIAAAETVRTTVTQFIVFLDDGALGSGVDWTNSSVTLYKDNAPQPVTVTAAYSVTYSRWCLTVVPTTALTSIGNNGNYELRVSARDRLGNSGTENFAFTYQNLTPVISTPATGTTVDNVSVSVTGQALATSSVYLQYSSDSGATWTSTDSVAAHATLNLFSKTLTLPAADGAYTLRAYSELAGAVSDYSNSVVVYLNRTFPTVAISSPADESDTNGYPMVITAQLTAGASPTYVRFGADLNGDGSSDTYYYDAVQPFQWLFYPPTPNREYTFRTWVSKGGDTGSASSAVDVMYDTVLPTVISVPSAGSYITDTPTYVEIIVSDTHSGADFTRTTLRLYQAGVQVSGGTVPVSATTLRLILAAPLATSGQCSIAYTVYDKAGNTRTGADTFTFVQLGDSSTTFYLVTTAGLSMAIDDGADTRYAIRSLWVNIPDPNAGNAIALYDAQGALVASDTTAGVAVDQFRSWGVNGNLTEGKYTIRVTQPDMLPNVAQVSFTLDTTPPTITTSPETGVYTSSIDPVYAYIADTATHGNYPSGADYYGCSITLTWPGGVEGPAGTVDAANGRVTLSSQVVATDGTEDGAASLTITAVDAVGNAAVRTVNFFYDSKDPAVRAADPYLYWTSTDTTQAYLTLSNGSITEQDVAVVAVALTDSWLDPAQTSVKLYNSSNTLVGGTAGRTGDTYYWRLSNPLNTVGEAGTYYLRLTAYDLAGNAITSQISFAYSPVDIERDIVDYATIEDTPSKTGVQTRQVEPDGDWLPVLRLRLRDTNLIAWLQGLRVDLVDSGTPGNLSSSDFTRRTAAAGSIVALYNDAGSRTGYFDAGDALVAANYLLPESGYDTAIIIAPTAPQQVLDTYTYFYVVLKGSRSMDFDDDFVVRVPQNGLFLNIGAKNDTASTNIYTANMPTFYNDLVTATPLNSNCSTAVIGISVHDNVGGNANAIQQVKVKFTGGPSFSQFDLAPLSNGSASGVSLYRDDGDGVWDAGDVFIAPSSVPTWSYPNIATLNFNNVFVGANVRGDSYFVVVRTSTSIQTGDTFQAIIPAEGLIFNNGERAEKGCTTAVITANADYDSPTGRFTGPANGSFLTNDAQVSQTKADLVFFIDNTSSMLGDITAVKNNITTFANDLATAGIDYQLSLYAYNDPGAAPPDTYVIYYGSTTDVNTFKGWVAQIDAHNGNAQDEMATEATVAALNTGADTAVPFRSGATKFFMYFTDGGVYDSVEGGPYTLDELPTLLNSNRVTPYFIYNPANPANPSGGGGLTAADEFEPIALATDAETANISTGIATILDNLAASISTKLSVSRLIGTAQDEGGAGLREVRLVYQNAATGVYAADSLTVIATQTSDDSWSWSFNIQALNLADGRYNFYLLAWDNLGNGGDTLDTLVINIDSTKPQVEVLNILNHSNLPYGMPGMLQFTGLAHATGRFLSGASVADTASIKSVEVSTDNSTWSTLVFGGDGLDNDGDGLTEEEPGSSFGTNDDWQFAIAGVPGDWWYDDLTGQSGVYEPGIDDVYLGVYPDTGYYKGSNAVLSAGANNVADAVFGGRLYALYDEDISDTDRTDEIVRWVHWYRPQTIGDVTLYFRVTDNAGNQTVLPYTFTCTQSVSATVTDYTLSAAPDTRYLESLSEPKAVLALNISDGAGGTDKIDTLAVRLTSVSGTFRSSDLAALATNATSGVMLYADNGSVNGLFDAADQPVALAITPVWASGAALAAGACDTVTFVFASGLDIPDGDLTADSGPDYFVVVRSSGTIGYKDDFTVSIPAGNITLLSGPLSATGTTGTITAKVPVTVTPLATGTTWVGRSDSQAVLAFAATDNAAGAPVLSQLTLTFANVGGDAAFTPSDLQPVTALGSSATGGVGIYTTNSVGFPAWLNINTVTWVGNTLVLTLFEDGVVAHGTETYTVYVRPGATISDNDDFTVAIASDGIQFTDGGNRTPVCTKTGTTGTIIADGTNPSISGAGAVLLNNQVVLDNQTETVYQFTNVTVASAKVHDALSGLQAAFSRLAIDTDMVAPSPAGEYYHDGNGTLFWLSNPYAETRALTTAAVQTTLSRVVEDANSLVVRDGDYRDVTALLGAAATRGSNRVTFTSISVADSGIYTFLYDPVALDTPPGNYLAVLSLMDVAGNQSTETYPFVFKQGDVVNPEVLSLNPAGSDVVGSLSKVAMLVYDAQAGIDYNRSTLTLTGPLGAISTSKDFNSTTGKFDALLNTALAADGTADGTYQFVYRLYDNAGNLTSDTISFTYNSSLPQVLNGVEDAATTRKAGDVITIKIGCVESRSERNLMLVSAGTDSYVVLDPPDTRWMAADTSLYTMRTVSSASQTYSDASSWRLDYHAGSNRMRAYAPAGSSVRAVPAGDSLSATYTYPSTYGAATADIGQLIQGITLYDDGDSLIDGSGSDGGDERRHDGYYTGRYTVQPGINTTAAEVTGKFSNRVNQAADALTFGSVSIDSLEPALSGLTASPVVFNPQQNEVTQIRFRVNEACAAITVNFTDSTGVTVRTIALGSSTQNEITLSWNGRNNVGQILSPGVYPYTITVSDLLGNSASINASVTISYVTLTVENIRLTRSTMLLPINDGVGDVTQVSLDVYMRNADTPSLWAMGLTYVDDSLGTVLTDSLGRAVPGGMDADVEPYALINVSLYQSDGTLVRVLDNDYTAGVDMDDVYCFEVGPGDDNTGNDYDNLVQLRDAANGVSGDGIFMGTLAFELITALPTEGTYLLVAQYELVRKDIVPSGLTGYHAKPGYITGKQTNPDNPASTAIRVSTLNAPEDDATPPQVSLVKITQSGGDEANITAATPTLYQGVTRATVILDDGFDGSGLDLANSTIRMKGPNSTLLAGTQNNDGSSSIWWQLSNTALEPGAYTVEVVGRDNASNAGAMSTYSFTLGDFQPPSVISWTYNSGQPLTTNAQVAATISKVSATLQDQVYGGGLNLAACTIGLYDANGILVSGAQSSDSIATLTWTLSPTLPQSTQVDSSYQVRVAAVDASGNDSQYTLNFTQQRQANASNITLAANSFGCTPGVISPNGDGRQDVAQISFIATSCDTIVPVLQFFNGINAFSTVDTSASAMGRLDSTVLGGGLSRYSVTWNPGAALTVGVYNVEVKLGNRINGNIVPYPTSLGWIIWDTLIDTPSVTAPTDSATVSSNSLTYALTVEGTYATSGDSVYVRTTTAAGGVTTTALAISGSAYTTAVTITSGWNTIEVWSADTAGNVSGITTRRVRLVNGSSATDLTVTIGNGTDREPVLNVGENLTIGLPYGTTAGGLNIYSTDGRVVGSVQAVDSDGDGYVDRVVWNGTGNNIVGGVHVFKLQYTLNGQVYVETFPLAIVP